MGLFDLVRRLLGLAPPRQIPDPLPLGTSADAPAATLPGQAGNSPQAAPSHRPRARRNSEARKEIRLEPLRYESSLIPTPASREVVNSRPYRFACAGPRDGQFLDLSQDSDQRWLDYYGLPILKTPDDLAAWLHIPIGKLAWLTYRTSRSHRAETERQGHYVHRWIRKRSGGWRLVEAPKPELKRIQQQVLREILDHVPAHAAAHGFVRDRSILTNAAPHLGRRFVLKFDLQDFYATVRYSRVVAIFRSLGFSREVAIWLARLTTSAVPWDLKAPVSNWELTRYSSRHLPQGAATSPALANLSAFGLDVRLSGLAEVYDLRYTRYADDLTFSGSGLVVPALREVIPLVRKIVHSERFCINNKKLRVLRDCQRQAVTGVVVNEKPNISRADYDRLKAILHNCTRFGPSTQNQKQHANFAEHLRGRIAHVLQLNETRGQKLLEIYKRIDWSR